MSGRRRARRHRSAILKGGALVVIAAVVVALVLRDNSMLSGDTPAASGPATTRGTTSASPTPEPQAIVRAGVIDKLPDPVCTPKPVSADLRVVSFNIKSALGGLARIESVLAGLDADVVMLQEVDVHRANSRYVDMPTVLGDQLGMYSAFGANVLRGSSRYGRSEYGTAILSKYPIVSSDNTLLPNGPGGQQRGLLHAVVSVKGVEVSVYGTHLQNKNPGLRVRQISAIETVMTADDRPKFLGGDFNDHPGSTVLDIAYRFLDDPWSDGVGSGSPNTHPATHPKGRIDYVLYDGSQLTPEGIYVVDSTASDHRPVSSSFHLAGFHGQVCHRPKADPSPVEQPPVGEAVDP